VRRSQRRAGATRPRGSGGLCRHGRNAPALQQPLQQRGWTAVDTGGPQPPDFPPLVSTTVHFHQPSNLKGGRSNCARRRQVPARHRSLGRRKRHAGLDPEERHDGARLSPLVAGLIHPRDRIQLPEARRPAVRPPAQTPSRPSGPGPIQAMRMVGSFSGSRANRSSRRVPGVLFRGCVDPDDRTTRCVP
jgi:hypothetical protein